VNTQGTAYVIEMLGRTLAERDSQIEQLAQEVRLLRAQVAAKTED
jgi:hypothetical protein